MCPRFLYFWPDWSNIGVTLEIVYWTWWTVVAREPLRFEDKAPKPIIGL